MIIFSVAITVRGEAPQATKDDLEVVIECAGIVPKTSVMGGKGGVFHVGFTPKDAGQYWADFVFKGMWTSTPYSLPITTSSGQLPDYSYEGKERRIRAPTTPAQGPEIPSTDRLPTQTSPEQPPTQQQPPQQTQPVPQLQTQQPPQQQPPTQQPSQQTQPVPVPQPQTQQQPPQQTQPVPQSRVQGQPDVQSPQHVDKNPLSQPDPKILKDALKRAFPPLCTATTQDFNSLTDTDVAKFTITARDEDGNILISNSSIFDVNIFPSTTQVNVTNNKDGSFTCSFGPLEQGTYNISVTSDGKAIKGSPWSVCVVEGVASAEFAEITILLQAINKKGEVVARGGDFSLFTVDTKGGKTSHLQDSGLEDGRYHFDYQAARGSNFINVISNANGKSIDGFPLSWTL